MPITLQEAKVGMADHVDQSVIDTFQRSSLLLDKLTFDNAISPGTGVVQSYMPDMAQPGAVKTGEVELVAGVALKNTLKAGVLKGIGTAPKQG